MKEEWIYETNKENTARYVLGIKGKNPLLILSINPSIGAPDVDTPTLGTVRKITQYYGYDSWIIMCLYPERATHVDQLSILSNPDWVKKNLEVIESIFKEYPNKNLWACWGTRIRAREYFPESLLKIVPIAQKYNEHWEHYGPLTEEGDPRYDLYIDPGEGFYPFNIEQYIERYRY